MPAQQHTFNLPYLQQQLEIISAKTAKSEAGKFYSVFTLSHEQHSCFVMLLAERIREMEAAKKAKAKEINY
jgi:hypothetical protein